MASALDKVREKIIEIQEESWLIFSRKWCLGLGGQKEHINERKVYTYLLKIMLSIAVRITYLSAFSVGSLVLTIFYQKWYVFMIWNKLGRIKKHYATI